MRAAVERGFIVKELSGLFARLNNVKVSILFGSTAGGNR